MPLKTKKIAFINEAHHVGGGQVYAQQFLSAVKELSAVKVHFFEKPSFWQWIQIYGNHYDVIILNLYTAKLVKFAFLLKFKPDKILVISYGIWKLEYESQKVDKKWVKSFTTFKLVVWQGLLFWLADRIVVLSKYHRQLIKQNFGRVVAKTTVIYGASERQLKQLGKNLKAVSKQKLGILPTRRLFLVVSRLERRKGVHLAIHAFAKVKNKDTLLLLVLSGGQLSDYSYLIELFELISSLKLAERVHICTGVSLEQRFEFFRAADVFIMSSTNYETFGLTTIEAMAHGCMIAGYQAGAITEILPLENRQFVTRAITVEGLEEIIRSVVSLNIDSLHDLQNKSLEANKRFAWDKSRATFKSMLD